MSIDDFRENRSSERRSYFMRVSEIPPPLIFYIFCLIGIKCGITDILRLKLLLVNTLRTGDADLRF